MKLTALNDSPNDNKVRAIFLFFFILFFLSIPISRTVAKGNPDVRVVVDVSGSMKNNDPDNLRQPAVDLVVELLPEQSKSGIWAFGQYVNMLVPYEDVSASWKSVAKKKLSSINSIGLRSNIGGALDKATQQYSQQEDMDVILLTDGFVDVSKNAIDNHNERNRILKSLIPQLKQRNIRIHSIALSDNADKDLLDELALQTGGVSFVAKQPEDLLKIFSKAVSEAVKADEIPLNNNAFVIDSSINEFTALLFQSPSSPNVELLSPSQVLIRKGNHSESVKWYEGKGYVLVTVKNPEAGEWFFQAEIDPDNRVTIISDLKMSVSGVPSYLAMGSKKQYDITFMDKSGVIKDQNFLDIISVSKQLHDDSEGADVIESSETEDNKILSFSRTNPFKISDDLGVFYSTKQFTLNILANGKTFQRKFSKTIRVIESVSISLNLHDHSQAAFLKVKSNRDDVDVENTRVIAKILAPSGSTLIQALPLMDQQTWELQLSNKQGDGEYQVNLSIKGKLLNGDTFDVNPETVLVQFPIRESLEKIVNIDKTDQSKVIPKLNHQTSLSANTLGNEEVLTEELSTDDLGSETDDDSLIEIPNVDAASNQDESKNDVSNTEGSNTEGSNTDEILDEEIQENSEVLEFDEEASDELESLEEPSGNIWVLIGIGIGGVVLVGSGIWWWLRRKSTSAADPQMAQNNSVHENEDKDSKSIDEKAKTQENDALDKETGKDLLETDDSKNDKIENNEASNVEESELDDSTLDQNEPSNEEGATVDTSLDTIESVAENNDSTESSPINDEAEIAENASDVQVQEETPLQQTEKSQAENQDSMDSDAVDAINSEVSDIDEDINQRLEENEDGSNASDSVDETDAIIKDLLPDNQADILDKLSQDQGVEEPQGQEAPSDITTDTATEEDIEKLDTANIEGENEKDDQSKGLLDDLEDNPESNVTEQKLEKGLLEDWEEDDSQIDQVLSAIANEDINKKEVSEIDEMQDDAVLDGSDVESLMDELLKDNEFDEIDNNKKNDG